MEPIRNLATSKFCCPNHRRGKWRGRGGSCPPWRYFGPPGQLLPPLRLLSWAIFGTKNASNIFLYRFWVKITLSPVKTFFLENAYILG